MNSAQLQQQILSFHVGRSYLFNKSKIGSIRLSRIALESDEFKQTGLLASIMEFTQFLTDYGIRHKTNISMKHRINAIFQNVTSVPLCEECHKQECFLRPVKGLYHPIFSSLCSSTVCHSNHAVKHKGDVTQHTKDLMSRKAKASKREIIDTAIFLLKTCDDVVLSDCMQQKCIEYCTQRLNRLEHVPSKDIKENQDLVRAIFKMTEFIEAKDPEHIKVKKDFALDERVYCIANGISSPVKCKFCQTNNVKFISLKKGYTDACTSPLCISDKIRYVKNQLTSKELIAKIEASGDYKVLSFPLVQNEEPLIVKCNKCGNISQHFLYNGILQHLEKVKLCDVCDAYSSAAERDIVNFLQQVCNQKDVRMHDRFLIAPNELDIYIPDEKLAIEYDGLYWHNADTLKSSFYHKMKTNLCDELQVDLIHIFENEMIISPNAVYDALKRHLCESSLVVVDAKECSIEEVEMDAAAEFASKNTICDLFLDAGEINYGLFYKGEMISILSASKKSDGVCKILCACDKIGMKVECGLSKLLQHLQQEHNVKKLTVNINRRWPILANKFFNEGFQLEKLTSIRALFYNTSCRSMNKNLLNKKQMTQMIGSAYDDSISLKENAAKVKYKCIYDCGDLVLTKNQ